MYVVYRYTCNLGLLQTEGSAIPLQNVPDIFYIYQL